jgi:hypothetical protein
LAWGEQDKTTPIRPPARAAAPRRWPGRVPGRARRSGPEQFPAKKKDHEEFFNGGSFKPKRFWRRAALRRWPDSTLNPDPDQKLIRIGILVKNRQADFYPG